MHIFVNMLKPMFLCRSMTLLSGSSFVNWGAQDFLSGDKEIWVGVIIYNWFENFSHGGISWVIFPRCSTSKKVKNNFGLERGIAAKH